MLCEDFNQDLAAIEPVQSALLAARLVCLASVYGVADEIAYAQTPGDPSSHVSAIDRVLVSPNCLQLVRDFALLPFDSCQHRPLHVTLDARKSLHTIQVMALPRPLKLSTANPAPASPAWDCHAQLESMVREGLVNEVFAQWSVTAERSLGAAQPSTCGRGRCPKLSSRPLLPLALPSAGLWEATTYRARRLAKLHRQLKEYRVRHLRGTCATAESEALLRAITQRLFSLGLPPPAQTLTNLTLDDLDREVTTVGNLLQAETRARKVERLTAWKTALTTSTTARHKWLRDGGQLHRSRCIRAPDGRLLTDPAEQRVALWAAWGAIYHRHSSSDAQQAAFNQEYSVELEHLRQQASPCSLPPITGALLRQQLRRMSSSGPGLDGWRPAELKALNLQALDSLAVIRQGCEDAGTLPDPWTCAVTTLLSKTGLADFRTGSAMVVEDPLAQRPITALGAPYRLWASLRFQQLSQWVTSWAPACLRDDVETATWKASLTLSGLRDAPKPFALLLLDKEKFFDLQCPALCVDVLRAIGCAPGVLRILDRFYQTLRRARRFNQAVPPWFTTSNGVAQGCSLSLYLVLAAQAALVTRLKRVVPDLGLSIYVDDTTAWSTLQSTWELFVAELALHDKLAGSSTNARKTKVFQTFDPPLQCLSQYSKVPKEAKLLLASPWTSLPVWSVTRGSCWRPAELRREDASLWHPYSAQKL